DRAARHPRQLGLHRAAAPSGAVRHTGSPSCRDRADGGRAPDSGRGRARLHRPDHAARGVQQEQGGENPWDFTTDSPEEADGGVTSTLNPSPLVSSSPTPTRASGISQVAEIKSFPERTSRGPANLGN